MDLDEKEVVKLAKEIRNEWCGYTWESAIEEAKRILESNKKYEIASDFYRIP